LDRKRQHITHIILTLLVTLFLYCFVFYLPFTPFFNYADQLFAMNEGNLILNGQIIYKDFWDFIFPGAPVFYALAFLIFGAQYWIVSATIVLIGVTTFWLTLSISKKVIDGPMYLLPALTYVFFGFRWFGLDGYHRMFSPIFILLAIWILLKGNGFWNWAQAGAACAFATFFTQQRGIVAFVAVLLFILLEKRCTGDATDRFVRPIFATCLGFTITLLLLCGYFMYQVGMSDFLYWTIVYPGKYYQYAPMNNYGVYLHDWKKALDLSSVSGRFAILPIFLYTVILPLANLFAIGLSLFRRHFTTYAKWRMPLLCLIVGTALMFSNTGPNQGRLFQIAEPSLIVFFWIINHFVSSSSIQRMLSYTIIVGLLLLGLVQAINIQTHWKYSIWKTPTGGLAVLDSPGDKPFLLFSQILAPGDYYFDPIGTNLLFPMQLRNPTRYYQIWNTDYTRPEMVADAVSDLQKNPPKYIQWHAGLCMPAEERAPGDHLTQLCEFLIANYEPFGAPYDEDGRTQLWRRMDLRDSK